MNSKILLTCCLFLSVIVGDKVIFAEKLSCQVPKHYEEIGCVANYEDDDDCPTKFTCPEFETFALNKCHVNGRSFDVGQKIADENVPMCRTQCRCRSPMNVECVNIECPEDDYIDRDSVPTIKIYKDLKECCSTVQTSINQIDNLSKCYVEGKTYYDGERIYPDGDSCFMCHCTQNFNNGTSFAENSNCVKINCGIEHDLHRFKAGCVPVYFKTPTCCPIDIKCPAKGDAIAEDVSGKFANEKLTCKFGDLTLKRGQKLKNNQDCLSCDCLIPPFLTCVQNPNCELSN